MSRSPRTVLYSSQPHKKAAHPAHNRVRRSRGNTDHYPGRVTAGITHMPVILTVICRVLMGPFLRNLTLGQAAKSKRLIRQPLGKALAKKH